jgi:hypothetical protein
VNLNQRMHKRIHTELDDLMRLGVLNENQVLQLRERYPVTAWNFMVLTRVFSVLGALTAAAGLTVLVREHLNWWLVSEAGLVFFALGMFVLGHLLRVRDRRTAISETCELLGCMAVQGLMTVLAVQHCKECDDWPDLAGMQTIVLFFLAYALANRLALWYACVNLFFWFGAETGYVSGWGCYWLGMTYPMRFLGAGMGTLFLSWLHGVAVRGRWAIFSRVYAHFGLLTTNLAFWFMTLFGYYENYDIRWSDTQGERLLFSLIWAVMAGGCLFAGARYSIRLLRGYGLTFLVINIYTFYFQFVAANTGELWFIHLLLTGGGLLWLGLQLERKYFKNSGK